MICERCGKDIYKTSTCNYCKRKIGIECVKSSRKISQTERIFICKDDWSDIRKRRAFKSQTSSGV